MPSAAFLEFEVRPERRGERHIECTCDFRLAPQGGASLCRWAFFGPFKTQEWIDDLRSVMHLLHRN